VAAFCIHLSGPGEAATGLAAACHQRHEAVVTLPGRGAGAGCRAGTGDQGSPRSSLPCRSAEDQQRGVAVEVRE
jgi:hypothetical protein